MIVGFFLNMVLVVLQFVVGLLPTLAMPAGIASAVTLFLGYANAYSFLWPIATYVQVIAFAAGFEFTMLTFNLALKIYHMARG